MKLLTLWLFAMLLIIAGFLQGCGTRKSAVVINKQTEKVKEETKSEAKEETKSEATKVIKEEEKTDKTDEKQEQRITELYNENGSLKSRITELLNSKSTDKSNKSKKSLETLKINTVKTVNVRTFITKEITIKDKTKNTEQSSKNWSTMIGIVLGFAVVAYFVYRWFKG